MKILVINPNTTAAMTESIGAIAKKYAAPGTEITVCSPEWGPRSIEGHFEEQIAALATIETVVRYRDDFDGFVIACYGDPGVNACREVTDKPVLGIAEASMHTACLLGHKFSVVTVIERACALIEDGVKRVGLSDRCASIRSTGMSVLEIEENPQQAVVQMVEQGRLAIRDDGAEVICLGCAGMGPLDDQLEEQLGVPVLDGTACAVKMLEGILAYGKSTSKVRAFAWPEKKELPGCSPLLQSVTSSAD
ncbi:MAG: aspartate/glutamate racemase family protein [Pseudomonadota bacterium]|jgi:allantoin racemase|uniref:aspartate/glutamate racemase family protein n=1 Tax=Rhizorhabdus wittichii TaxID=160791 RepID=UPI0002D8C1F8|nr:aspartate/glutamate racemase family protein [Rhizorhabdus wittichii]